MTNTYDPNQASPQSQQNTQHQQAAPQQSLHGNQGRKPDYIAYTVTPGPNNKGYFNKIGASWTHRDGEGHEIQLDALPVNGRISLRTQRDNRMQDYQNQQAQMQQAPQQVVPQQMPAYDGPSQ